MWIRDKIWVCKLGICSHICRREIILDIYCLLIFAKISICVAVKCAVYNLTVLKHKNICLQIFRKLFRILVSKKKKKSNSRNVCSNKCVGMSVSILVCGGLPNANLPNGISTSRVASHCKTQRLSTMESSKRTGSRSQILPNLKCLGIHLKSSKTRGKLK